MMSRPFSALFASFRVTHVIALGVLASVLLAAIALPARAADYPTRPVTLIVPWGAGGGTDATARILGALLEKELGQPINVINRTGGSGVVGHQAIVSAPPDGYTIGIATVEITMMHWAGLTPLTPSDLTPIALVNLDSAAVTVRADSPYKSVPELVAAIKANPGKLKASGAGKGGIWHLALAGMLSELKVEPAAAPWVPSNGAAPAMTDLVAGGVDVVTVSLPEARAMIDAGKARALAVMADQPASLYPAVPTLKAQTGADWTIGAWRGIVGPKNLPAPVVERLGAALKKIYDGKAYQDFMAQRGYGTVWADAAAFGPFMAKGDQEMGITMKAVGIAK